MNEKEIINILDNIDISENDFDYIDVELNDIEKKRIRKNYKKTITKKSSILKKVAIACVLVIAIGITPIITSPVMASNIPVLSNIYEILGIYNEYKDYTTYIGQSIKVSKYTYTIDNIMVTPYESLMAIKITSTEPIPEDHNGFMIDPSIGGVHWNSGSSDKGYRIDDYNIVTFIKHDYLNKVPKKSTIKINIQSMDSRDEDTNTSGTFEFKADFDRSYTEFTSLPVKNASIDKFGITVKKINSSIMGTDIVSKIFFKCNDEGEYLKTYDKLELVLNIDGKLYSGFKFEACDNYFGILNGSIITKIDGLDVNTINNSKNISLLIYESKYSSHECFDLRESLNETIQQPDCIEEQNVSFVPYFEFSTGRKGEFYGLERNGNTVKFHYKGKSSDIVPLSQMRLWYEGNMRGINSKVSLNPNNENDFTIEFNNVPENKKASFTFWTYDFNDYTFLDTVKIK